MCFAIKKVFASVAHSSELLLTKKLIQSIKQQCFGGDVVMLLPPLLLPHLLVGISIRL